MQSTLTRSIINLTEVSKCQTLHDIHIKAISVSVADFDYRVQK